MERDKKPSLIFYARMERRSKRRSRSQKLLGRFLADLYDPKTMPPVLVKAHQALDKAVDLCYRPQPFINETKRIEFLFELYDKYTSGMFGSERKKNRKKLKE